MLSLRNIRLLIGGVIFLTKMLLSCFLILAMLLFDGCFRPIGRFFRLLPQEGSA